MCIVYNTLGCIRAIDTHLRKNNIDGFTSVDELLGFQKNYASIRQQTIAQHLLIIDREKNTLADETIQLSNFIHSKKSTIEQQLQSQLEQLQQQLHNLPAHRNIFRSFIGYFKRTGIQTKIHYRKLTFHFSIQYSVRQPTKTLAKKNKRYQYLLSNFDDAVNTSSYLQLRELERKKNILDAANSLIYGALGEQQVAKELEKLPDDYILINDFTYSFQPPIFHRQHDFIKSIQIDHLLIAPSGVFIIETKNWSEHSLHNPSLRSPVQQVRRTSFALYRLLERTVTRSGFLLSQHHWGVRRVPIKNVVVFTRQKPSAEFEHVKMLTPPQLLSYIKYFAPQFTKKETQLIAASLLHLSRIDKE